ncbi:MAG TPA: RNA polymerase sigma factor [Solirubrobacteraceae bacterium]|jgi:RNA polymerase sigma factor (sigma-70 family)
MSPRVPIRLLAAQSDRRLVELVETGHERAFEVLVHRYRRQLLRYCRRLGLSDSRAEDALQQSLLRAWLSLRRGVQVRELKPWLYRIVHNTAVNVMRSSREQHAPLTDVAEITLVGGVEHALEQRIAAHDALAHVAALPPMQREAILLSAVDGRSHEEVASALGITDGAVRGLLYRARATLRSAAAALIPAPLLAWAAGGAARVTPSLSRVAELSGGPGGSEAGGALLKGVAVALTSAAAAGAVLVPLAHHRRQRPAGGARHGAVAARTSATASSAAAVLGAGAHARVAPILAVSLGGHRTLTPEPGLRRGSVGTHVTSPRHDRSGSRGGDSGSRGGDSSSRASGADGRGRGHGDGRDGASPRSSAPNDGSGGRGTSRSGGGDGSLVASSGSGTSSAGASGSDSSGAVSGGSSSGSSGSGDSSSGGSSDGGPSEREAEAEAS